ncbi:hypothetical protein WICPIJ_009224, partial [Wickerhamomyces pijperi]
DRTTTACPSLNDGEKETSLDQAGFLKFFSNGWKLPYNLNWQSNRTATEKTPGERAQLDTAPKHKLFEDSSDDDSIRSKESLDSNLHGTPISNPFQVGKNFFSNIIFNYDNDDHAASLPHEPENTSPKVEYSFGSHKKTSNKFSPSNALDQNDDSPPPSPPSHRIPLMAVNPSKEKAFQT